jgi:hypothetical protein
VLGMRQAGVSEAMCAELDSDLAHWLAFLLQRGVRVAATAGATTTSIV